MKLFLLYSIGTEKQYWRIILVLLKRKIIYRTYGVSAALPKPNFTVISIELKDTP